MLRLSQSKPLSQETVSICVAVQIRGHLQTGVVPEADGKAVQSDLCIHLAVGSFSVASHSLDRRLVHYILLRCEVVRNDLRRLGEVHERRHQRFLPRHQRSLHHSAVSFLFPRNSFAMAKECSKSQDRCCQTGKQTTRSTKSGIVPPENLIYCISRLQV